MFFLLLVYLLNKSTFCKMKIDKISTPEEYETVINRVELFSKAHPKSPEAKELKELTKLLVAYEKEQFAKNADGRKVS